MSLSGLLKLFAQIWMQRCRENEVGGRFNSESCPQVMVTNPSDFGLGLLSLCLN